MLAAAIVSDRVSFGFAAGDLYVEIAAPVGVNAVPFSDTGDGLGELSNSLESFRKSPESWYGSSIVAGWAMAVGLLIVADSAAGDA